MNVVIFPSFVGSSTFKGLKVFGADFTGTNCLPSMTIGLTLSLVIGMKCCPFTLMTGFSVGFLVSSFFAGSKHFALAYGITFKGM